VLSVPPPTIAFIRRKFATGQTVVVNDGVLLKGATYEVGGVALILANAGSVMHSATMRLNGQTLPLAQAVSAAAGSTLAFSVPSTATSGALTFETRVAYVKGVAPMRSNSGRVVSSTRK